MQKGILYVLKLMTLGLDLSSESPLTFKRLYPAHSLSLRQVIPDFSAGLLNKLIRMLVLLGDHGKGILVQFLDGLSFYLLFTPVYLILKEIAQVAIIFLFVLE